MINNQHNGNEKRFVPHNRQNIQPRSTSRSFSTTVNNVNVGTKSFVAENLNKLGTPNPPMQTVKNLVFVRKEQSFHAHSNRSNSHGHRNSPKKHGVRKVISEFATKKEHVIPPLAEGNIRIIPL